MQERWPALGLRALTTAAVLTAFAVHWKVYIASGGQSWRNVIKQSAITPAWWADAGMQTIAFVLQLLGVAYSWLPAGYTIDHRKTVIVEAVAMPWAAHAAAMIAADISHLSLGVGPTMLTFIALLGSVCGFVAMYWGLRTLHPLMVRVRKAEGSLVNSKSTLVRKGTRANTAFIMYRLPTGIAAALCACRAATETASFGMALTGVEKREALNPSLGMLVVMLVLAVSMMNHLDEVAFVVTVWAWLMLLIVATHTLLIVKCFCIALVIGLTMRALFKFVPDYDDEVEAAKLFGSTEAKRL